MLATIINFSTNETEFLGHCLEEALVFSDQIIVCVCDHFFDGTKENQKLLNGIYKAHPEVTFIQYAWSKKGFYANHSTHFWHNLSRLLGVFFLSSDIENILFLDVDEIVEGKRFANWLKQKPLDKYAALRLACFWYFRKSCFQAKTWEDTPLLIRRGDVDYDLIMQIHERAGMFARVQKKKSRNVLGSQDLPMIHHYSWVRDKNAMLRKIRCWGHREERDWEKLVEEEFSRSFLGRDFIHGYEFSKVAPYLKKSKYSLGESLSKNVKCLSISDVNKIDLMLKFDL